MVNKIPFRLIVISKLLIHVFLFIPVLIKRLILRGFKDAIQVSKEGNEVVVNLILRAFFYEKVVFDRMVNVHHINVLNYKIKIEHHFKMKMSFVFYNKTLIAEKEGLTFYNDNYIISCLKKDCESFFNKKKRNRLMSLN